MNSSCEVLLLELQAVISKIRLKVTAVRNAALDGKALPGEKAVLFEQVFLVVIVSIN